MGKTNEFPLPCRLLLPHHPHPHPHPHHHPHPPITPLPSHVMTTPIQPRNPSRRLLGCTEATWMAQGYIYTLLGTHINIPCQVIFEDVFPFPKVPVGYVSWKVARKRCSEKYFPSIRKPKNSSIHIVPSNQQHQRPTSLIQSRRFTLHLRCLKITCCLCLSIQ